MNSEVKKQWVAALRSGEYRQGRNLLKTSDGRFCCLGVLCDLHSKTFGSNWDSTKYLGAESVLPDEVILWAELITCDVSVNGVTLASRNDGCYGYPPESFEQIADLIEQKL